MRSILRSNTGAFGDTALHNKLTKALFLRTNKKCCRLLQNSLQKNVQLPRKEARLCANECKCPDNL